MQSDYLIIIFVAILKCLTWKHRDLPCSSPSILLVRLLNVCHILFTNHLFGFYYALEFGWVLKFPDCCIMSKLSAILLNCVKFFIYWCEEQDYVFTIMNALGSFSPSIGSYMGSPLPLLSLRILLYLRHIIIKQK